MREREISMSLGEAVPLIEQVTSGGGVLSLCAQGVSMQPTIIGGRDIMKLGRLDTPERHDVVLYRRASGEYVLHRIVGQDGDGYIMCGDSQITLERGIARDMMIAKLVAVQRGDKEISTVGAKNRARGRYMAFLRGVRRVRHGIAKLIRK